MNTIDQMTPAQIDAEKQAILASIPEAETAPATPGAEPPAMNEDQAQQIAEQNWLPVLNGVLPMLAVAALPQWELQKAELDEFGKALAGCLETVFPGGFAGKYACWCRLIAAGGGICAIRYMQHGKLPPVGRVVAVVEKKAETEAAAT